MHQPCKECAARQGEGSVEKQTITSISSSTHNALFEALAAGLQAEQVPLATGASGFSRLTATPRIITQIHTTPDGGVFATAAMPTANGAKVRLTGSIGLAPSVLTLAHTLDYQGKAVAVSLTVEQPVRVEQTWHFNFAGVTPLPNGNFMASSVEPDTTKAFLSPQFSLDQRSRDREIAPIDIVNNYGQAQQNQCWGERTLGCLTRAGNLCGHGARLSSRARTFRNRYLRARFSCF